MVLVQGRQEASATKLFVSILALASLRADIRKPNKVAIDEGKQVLGVKLLGNTQNLGFLEIL